MMSEVDLKNLKEYWAERCMFEVMKLEGCIFDKIDQIEAKLERQIRDMGVQQNTEIRALEERLQQQSEADGQKLHRRLETLRQEQRAETAEVLSSPNASVSAQLTQYQMQIDAVEASMADLRRELGGFLQSRHEQEDSSREAREKWSRLEAMQNEQAQTMQAQAAGFAAEHSAKMQELSAALEAASDVASTCQRLQSEAAVNSSKDLASLSQQIEDVSRRCNECNSKLQNVKQDQMCELVTLRGRFEATTGEQEAKLVRLESMTSHLKQEHNTISAQSLSRSASPEAEVVALLKKRLDTLGVDLAVLSKRFEAQERASAEDVKLNNDPKLVSRIEEIESFHSKWAKRLESVEGLHEDVTLQSSALRGLKEQLESNSHPSSSNNLRAAITETRTDVGLLASQLAEEIQERQSTSLDVSQIKGQLTEEMSKAAVAILERVEQRLSSEIANERLWTEQLVNQQMSRKDCLDRLAELSTAASGGSNDNDSIGANSDIARNVGRIVGDMEAELRVQLTSRINNLQGELHTLQTEVSAHVSSIKGRLAAVEAGSGAPPQTVWKPLDDFRAATSTLAGRTGSSGPDDAGSSSSRGTSEPAPPRLGRTEQDASVLEAIQENLERNVREGMAARSVSPPKLASLLSPASVGPDSNLPRSYGSAEPNARKSTQTPASHGLPKDLKHTLEHLAEAVHRTLKDPAEQGTGRPHSASRPVVRGSFAAKEESGGPSASPRDPASLPLTSPLSVQRQSPLQEARQVSIPTRQEQRSPSTGQRLRSGLGVSDYAGGSLSVKVGESASQAGSLTVKVGGASTQKMLEEVSMSNANLSQTLPTSAIRPGSVSLDPSGRPSLPSDMASHQMRTMSTRTPMQRPVAGGAVTDANGISRGRQTRSLQPPGHTSTNPSDGSPRSRHLAQSAAPNAGAVGTMPQMGSATTRVASRNTGYPTPQTMPRSPGPQVLRGTAGFR